MPSSFLSSIIPGFDENAGTSSDVIKQLLTGNVNPGSSQIAGATFGAQNGLGVGSGLSNHVSYDLYNQQAAGRKQQGIDDLLKLIGGISSPTLENQGQQYGFDQSLNNLGQRQHEFNTDQNNINSDRYFRNVRQQQQDAASHPPDLGYDPRGFALHDYYQQHSPFLGDASSGYQDSPRTSYGARGF